MNWKNVFSFLLVLIISNALFAQTDTGNLGKDTSVRKKTDTAVSKKADTARRKKDTTKPVTKPVTQKPPTTRPSVQKDTAAKDSSTAVADTLKKDPVAIAKPPAIYTDTSTYYAYLRHPLIAFNKAPFYMVMKEKAAGSKDALFYLLVGLLFFVAFTRLLFPKYFQNTFRLFFQTTFRQKQTRDQLLQQSLGSLLLNLLFFFSGAFYLTLVLQHYEWTIFPFWQLLLYSSLALLTLYVGKFLFLGFAGWVFNVKEGAQTYIFIVFLINKIIGVMLIPFILVIAFSDSPLADAAITASLILIGLLFFYRYFVSLKSFRRDLHINPFHFFLYLCGVEIVPLLVIGKAVFNYIEGRF
jgi:hypothetical protein